MSGKIGVLRLTIITVAGLFSLPGHAAFFANETDWAGWSEMCRARYTVSGSGRDSEFVSRVPPGVVKEWESRMGPGAWYALHHYCYGVADLARSKAERDPAKSAFRLHEATEEFLFMLNRTPKEHPMYAETSIQLGLTNLAQKDREGALRNFDRAIATHPEMPGAYQGKALLYRDLKQYTEARDVLLAGDKATEGKSADIQYFLGLALIDLKDYEGARERAIKAYELGYPLTGLRDKLARAGYPLP